MGVLPSQWYVLPVLLGAANLDLQKSFKFQDGSAQTPQSLLPRSLLWISQTLWATVFDLANLRRFGCLYLSFDKIQDGSMRLSQEEEAAEEPLPWSVCELLINPCSSLYLPVMAKMLATQFFRQSGANEKTLQTHTVVIGQIFLLDNHQTRILGMSPFSSPIHTEWKILQPMAWLPFVCV